MLSKANQKGRGTDGVVRPGLLPASRKHYSRTRPPNIKGLEPCATVVVFDWANEIRRVWAEGSANTFELARVVASARKLLGRGNWSNLFGSGETPMPFCKRKGDMLVRVALLNGLNEQTFAHLPHGWTVESFNGARDPGQGNFTQWFSGSAFGGTGYSNTPVAAVSHTDEPQIFGIEDASVYFGLWASGKNFAICAWKSRNTPYFQAVGDPLIRR